MKLQLFRLLQNLSVLVTGNEVRVLGLRPVFICNTRSERNDGEMTGFAFRRSRMSVQIFLHIHRVREITGRGRLGDFAGVVSPGAEEVFVLEVAGPEGCAISFGVVHVVPETKLVAHVGETTLFSARHDYGTDGIKTAVFKSDR